MQGGKIRRLDVATREVSTIPFTAPVHRTISEMARQASSASPTVRCAAKFFRWPSSYGRRQDDRVPGGGPHLHAGRATTGTPRRLTSAAFDPLEYAPAWSPDGRSLAFVTWDDTAAVTSGRCSASGGMPQRVTREPGDYVDPVWSPDGRSIVVARGEGATARRRTLTHNAWYDLVRARRRRRPVATPAGYSRPSCVLRARPSAASHGASSCGRRSGRKVASSGSTRRPRRAGGGRGGTALMSVQAGRQRQAGAPQLPRSRRDRAVARR